MASSWVVTEEPMAGYTLTNNFRLLWQNRFRVHPKYLPRLLYGLGVSTLLSPLRLVEALGCSDQIHNARIDHDPIFITGYYRTGTTYLITLFSKDRSKGYVSNIEGYLPSTFLYWPRFTRWVISASLPDKRPMDEVLLGPDEPTEEEYSIGAYEKYSIYNGFIFPQNFDLYSRYNSFDGLPRDLERWKRRFQWFHRKLTAAQEGRQIVYKNPTSTFRIRHLLEMYPNAKFIHIYRDPYEVFASNLHYHRKVFSLYALQTWSDEEMQQTVLRNYREMYEKFDRDRHLIPEGNLSWVKYEEFIEKPMRHMERIYTELGLDGLDQARPSFLDHVDAQKSYCPNQHRLTDDLIRKVNEHWTPIIERFDYERRRPATA